MEQLVGAGGDVVNGGKLAGGDDPRLHLSSDRRTFVNLLISFVGAGVLGIPFAFRQVWCLSRTLTSPRIVVYLTFVYGSSQL